MAKEPGYLLCTLDNLRVPHLTEGPVDFQPFDKYERRRSDADAAINRLSLQGMSTRRLKALPGSFAAEESAPIIFSEVTNGVYQNGHNRLPTISAPDMTAIASPEDMVN